MAECKALNVRAPNQLEVFELAIRVRAADGSFERRLLFCQLYHLLVPAMAQYVLHNVLAFMANRYIDDFIQVFVERFGSLVRKRV